MFKNYITRNNSSDCSHGHLTYHTIMCLIESFSWRNHFNTQEPLDFLSILSIDLSIFPLCWCLLHQPRALSHSRQVARHLNRISGSQQQPPPLESLFSTSWENIPARVVVVVLLARCNPWDALIKTSEIGVNTKILFYFLYKGVKKLDRYITERKTLKCWIYSAPTVEHVNGSDISLTACCRMQSQLQDLCFLYCSCKPDSSWNNNSILKKSDKGQWYQTIVNVRINNQNVRMCRTLPPSGVIFWVTSASRPGLYWPIVVVGFLFVQLGITACKLLKYFLSRGRKTFQFLVYVHKKDHVHLSPSTVWAKFGRLSWAPISFRGQKFRQRHLSPPKQWVKWCPLNFM